MIRFSITRRCFGAAVLIFCLHAGADEASPPAARILDARDHAELATEMSAGGVVRVALIGDRIERVVRAPGGWSVEHDAGAGDVYLRPPAKAAAPEEPVALFIGSERGFTYRLALQAAERGPAQILIRNAAAGAAEGSAGRDTEGGRIAALTALIRAVANGTPPVGYAMGPAGTCCARDGVNAIEVWRGPQFDAWVLVVGEDGPRDAQALAERLGPDIAAAWLAGNGTGASGGRNMIESGAHSRVAVAVREVSAE